MVKAQKNAETSAQIEPHSIVAGSGRMISRMPTKPNPTATQRPTLTRSPNIGIDRMVMKMGAAMPIAIVLGRGTFVNAT
jgi:hypothetical protein